MPCTLTAFSVRIAASGEMDAIAREVLGDWNETRSWVEKKAFLALPAEEDAIHAPPDLIVAFVDAAQKEALSPTGIERHGNRPILIYYSEARTDFARHFTPEAKKSGPAEIMVDSFKDEKDFRAKFARQLEALVHYHPHFRTGSEVPVAVEINTEYSKAAQALLMNACDDPEAYLARRTDSHGLKIQVNGRQFVELGDPASAVQWGDAFEELLAEGLIRDAGCNGQLFQVSAKGFEFLETLGKHPIGYIAELGGM